MSSRDANFRAISAGVDTWLRGARGAACTELLPIELAPKQVTTRDIKISWEHVRNVCRILKILSADS
jgi:hypothetical protein